MNSGKRVFFRLLTVLAGLSLAFMLASCGGSGYSQTQQTENYTVQLGLDGTNFDQHTAVIDVHDNSGQPVDNAQVIVAPLMAAHGMASPEQTAQPQGNGRYQAKAEFFSMIGDWEFDVRIAANGTEEIARFTVPVQE